jgi:2'-5' RNA ligase
MAARLFFALWPDVPAVEALWRATRPVLEELRGRIIPAAEFHLTLVFLGFTEVEDRACFEAAADEVRATPLSLRLDRIGHWPRPQVLWAGASSVPPELIDLVGQLERGLSACGFRGEGRPYVPHVTLLRRCRRAHEGLAMQPVDWHFTEFGLVESVSGEGPRYRVRRRWPLAG